MIIIWIPLATLFINTLPQPVLPIPPGSCYVLKSLGENHWVELFPPSGANPKGLSICTRRDSGKVLWMAEVYSPGAAISLDGRAFAVWDGPVAKGFPSSPNPSVIAVYYLGRQVFRKTVEEIFTSFGKENAKTSKRTDGATDWLFRPGEFQLDGETLRLTFIGGHTLEINGRTGQESFTLLDSSWQAKEYLEAGRTDPGLAHSNRMVLAAAARAFWSGNFLPGEKNRSFLFCPPILVRSYGLLSGLAGGGTRNELNGLLGLPEAKNPVPAGDLISDWESDLKLSGWKSETGFWLDNSVKADQEALDYLEESGVILNRFPAGKASEIKADISRWLEKRFKGSSKFSIPDMPPELIFLLCTAAQFEANWERKFENDQYPLVFRLSDKESCKIPAVRGDQMVRMLTGDDGLVAASITFKEEKSDFLILQSGPKDFDLAIPGKILSDPDRLVRLIAEIDMQKPVERDVFIPRLSMKTTLDFAALGPHMGKLQIFNPGKADFSGLIQSVIKGPVQFSSRQSVSFDLGKYGVSAQAFQSEAVSSLGVNPVFKVDRPFVFLVRDRITGVFLFVGRVSDPR